MSAVFALRILDRGGWELENKVDAGKIQSKLIENRSDPRNCVPALSSNSELDILAFM